MPTLDLRAIILLVGVMGLLMSAIIFFLRRSLPSSIEGLGEWAAAPAVIVLATVLLGMRGTLPDFFSVLCGNLLLMAGCGLLLLGARRFFGLKPLPSYLTWGFGLTSALAITWVSLIQPDYGIRLRVMAILMLVIFVSLARVMYRQAGATFAGRFTATVVALQSVVIFLRLLATLVWPSGSGLFEPFIYQTLYITSFTFTMLLLTVGTVLLINERMRSEFQAVIEESRKGATAVLEARNQLQATLDAIPDLMFEMDIHGRYYSLHSRETGLLAAPAEKLLGRTVAEMLPPEAAATCLAALREAEARGQSRGSQFVLPLSQGPRWFELSIARKAVLPSQDARYIVLSRDITERKQFEQYLKDQHLRLEEQVRERTRDLEIAKEAAEAANRAKSSFLANMSHEIRTPMNGILGMAHLMRREGVTPKQQARLETIDASAQHLLGIINNVLDISKIEAGKVVLEEAPIDVGELLAHVADIVAERARAKRLRLLIEAPAMPAKLVGDATRLQQALLNYATNAIKFTEQGSVTLCVRILEDGADTMFLRFEVRDTGVGIPAEAIGRLFAPFEQADNSITRKYGGTGLGLVITRRLAQLMGGEAGAESAPGVGSTFWFTVRARKEADARQPAAEPVATDAESEIRKGHSGRRILIVDDEPVNREIARLLLADTGLAIDTAEDGAMAIRMAGGAAYAAILMDIQMPHLNGLEATRQIRALSGGPDIPIIAMTANAFAEDRERCFAAGMSDFLMKPFEPGQLFATLLRALNRRPG